MAAVESDLPPAIPHPIADATDSPHATHVAVRNILESEIADSQPSATDTDVTPLPEVTKLALDDSALVDTIESSTHNCQDPKDTSNSGQTEMATVNPNDVAVHDTSESTITLVKSVTEDTLMENDVKVDDIEVSLTEPAPGLSSSDLNTAATEKTAEAMILKPSGDESVSGSEEIKGDPSPVVGQDVTEPVSGKPSEEPEKEETATVAEANSVEQDDKADNDLVVEDTETKADDGEAPGVEITAVVESEKLEEEATASSEAAPAIEQVTPEEEAKDHSAAKDGLASDNEAKIEVEQADASGAEAEDKVAESIADEAPEAPEEAMKVVLEEADEHKQESVEPAVGNHVEEPKPTEPPVELLAVSSVVNEAPVAMVPAAVESPDLGKSNIEIPEETLSSPCVSLEKETSEETIVPHPEAETIDPPQTVVEEPASPVQEDVLGANSTAADEAAPIEEKEVTASDVEEPTAEVEHPVDTSELLVAESHPAARVEADPFVEEPAVLAREENILDTANIGTDSVVEEVVDAVPGSPQREAATQESSTEMVHEPDVNSDTQLTPEEQPSVEEIAPAAADVTESSVVEAATDSVSEAPVAEESLSQEAPVVSEATAEPVVEKVEEAPVVESATEAQKAEVEHETTEVQETEVEQETVVEVISSKQIVEEPPATDHQPPVDLVKNPYSEDRREEETSAGVDMPQDEKHVDEVQPPAAEVEKVLVEENPVESDNAAAEQVPAEAENAVVEEPPAEIGNAAVEAPTVEVETALLKETSAEIEKATAEEISAEVEKAMVEELPAEVEQALADETPAEVKVDASEKVPEPVVEEERSIEAPTTIESEHLEASEAAADIKDEVIEKVTETFSEETTVDSALVDEGVAEQTDKPSDVPSGGEDTMEASVGPVDEKEEVAVKQDVEQTGEPEQVQHLPSMGDTEDITLETAEVSTSVEVVLVVETETVVDEEPRETPITENLADNAVAVEIPVERDTIDALVAEGEHEEPKEATMDESAAQQSEAVISHEIGDAGAVTSEGQSEVVPSMDDSVVSEVSEADTTAETIIVPEPVTQKKSDSVTPVVEDLDISQVDEAPILVHDDIQKDELQLDIPGEATQVERPKSPWTPSFQVTTIGPNFSLPSEEDIPVHSLDVSEETTAVSSEETPVAINGNSNDAPGNVPQDEGEKKDEPKSASSLWTPSYSVHSQGSPNPPHVALEPEIPVTADKEAEVETSVPTVEETPVHEDDTHEPEHVETQLTVADQAEGIAIELTSVTEEPIAVLENAISESTDVKELSNEVLVEAPVSVATVPEQDTQVIPNVGEELPKEDQPMLETAPAEPQLLEQHTTEDDSSLTPPKPQSRSASPSWVPSYSVSTQGSPLPHPLALPSADISEIRLAPQQTDSLVQEDIENDTTKDKASSETAPIVAVDGTQAVEAEKAQPAEDRPTTPWTPSYSVTVQGTDVLDETTLESLSPPAQPYKGKEPEVRQRRSLSEEMESGAFSPTALIGAGVAGGTAVYAASAAFRKSSDGKTSTDIVEPEMHQEKPFPTVQIPEGSKESTAPRHDSNEGSSKTAVRSPETSPTSSRKRLESTTSSRLFPGGWFSNSSKIPDERTSLEVAQGEFTGAKQGGTIEESIQSPTSPTAEPITPVREQSSSDKRKWCIIM